MNSSEEDLEEIFGEDSVEERIREHNLLVEAHVAKFGAEGAPPSTKRNPLPLNRPRQPVPAGSLESYLWLHRLKAGPRQRHRLGSLYLLQSLR